MILFSSGRVGGGIGKWGFCFFCFWFWFCFFCVIRFRVDNQTGFTPSCLSTMTERNAWFTLCALEVVGGGVGIENSVVDVDGKAGVVDRA